MFFVLKKKRLKHLQVKGLAFFNLTIWFQKVSTYLSEYLFTLSSVLHSEASRVKEKEQTNGAQCKPTVNGSCQW